MRCDLIVLHNLSVHRCSNHSRSSVPPEHPTPSSSSLRATSLSSPLPFRSDKIPIHPRWVLAQKGSRVATIFFSNSSFFLSFSNPSSSPAARLIRKNERKKNLGTRVELLLLSKLFPGEEKNKSRDGRERKETSSRSTMPFFYSPVSCQRNKKTPLASLSLI